MQARVDWVLIILGTQVIKKKRPVRPVYPDYLSVSYDHAKTEPTIWRKCSVYRIQNKFPIFLSIQIRKLAICKPRHWNLGTGIGNGVGIGTDTAIAIFPVPLGSWTPNFAGWWLRMRGLHPQSHVTSRYHGHVTNQKRYISSFTRSMDLKLDRVVT